MLNSTILASDDGVMLSLLAELILNLNGYNSAFQWYNMLNRPRLGVKNVMKVIILLIEAKRIQQNTVIFCLTLKNPFSATSVLICVKIAEKRLSITETASMAVGLVLKPRKESSSKKLSSPPVVAVAVLAIKRTRNCNGI